MRVLVLGGGGREHVLSWKLAQSPRVEQVYCAPGNGGIARDVETVAINADSPGGIEEAARWARDHGIDLTVVGPEAPLVAGVVDHFESAGLRVFGPNAKAARLEGSKCFTKDFLARHDIPTAAYRNFNDAGEALEYVETVDVPVVVKADGLAAGKGVIIARSREEARAAVDEIMIQRRFGDAGDRVVVEEFMPGAEMTLIVITDGETALPLETAQDYKPAFNGNQGPNTGGMGSYSPHVPLDDSLVTRVLETIIQPTLDGFRADGIDYRGALYAGLMVTDAGPRLLEYNVRFGDPEIQSILFRLRTDLVDVFEACLERRLASTALEWDPRSAVCVVGASAGYPGSYAKGKVIRGIETAEAASDDVKVFVAGASANDSGELVTSGGRVLGVTALGDDLATAREHAYAASSTIAFDGMHRRDDIGIPARLE